MSTRPHLLPALATAFAHDGTLDLASCRRLFAHVADLDVEAHFVAGTTGEFVALSDDERIAVLEAAVEEIGTTHVFAHVGAASTHQAVTLAHRARDVGATRFAAVTPYYTDVPGDALLDYYVRLRDVLDGDDELFAYVFPARTGVDVDPERLADVVVAAGLDGVKVSVPGTRYVADLVASLPDDVPVYSGNDALLPEVLDAGGAGVVSGVMQVGPAPFLRQAQALRAGDRAAALAARADVDPLVAAVGPSLRATKQRLVDAGLFRTAVVRVPAARHPRPAPVAPAVAQV